jgi:ketosteroid isomerase-like protein
MARRSRLPTARSRHVVLAMVLAACAKAPISQPTPSGDESAIRAARAQQNAAIAAGNFDDVARFWTEDITVRAGLGFALRGTAAYRTAFSSDTSITYVRELEGIEVSEQWPLAWESGSWVGRRRGSGELLIAGRYGAQWLKVDGAWKIRSEVFVALSCTDVACRWPVAR